MEKMNALTLIITLVVGVILTGALLGPVISDATNTEDTFTNEGLWRMKEIEDGDVWTFNSSPYSWNYNGVAQSSVSVGGSSALLGDTWTIRSNGQARGPEISGNATTLSATANEVDITFTGVSGVLSYPVSGYGIKDDGAYIMSDYTKPTYVLGDSTIYATGISAIDDVGCTINIVGTIDDGVTINLMNNRNVSNISNAVFSNVSINAEKINGYVNLYKLSSITADVTFDNTSEGTTTTHTGSITYSSYVVPYEVTAELSNHLTPGQISLMGAIPVMVIVALLMAAVGAIALRRAD